MNWQRTWARAQVTPVVVSAMVWLIVLALWPATAGLWVLVSMVVVAGWNSRPALRIRFAARPMPAADRDAVLRILIPMRAFRGRGQPELWVSGRAEAAVITPAKHLLVLDQRVLNQVQRGAASDIEVCTHAARALSLLPVHRSRTVATVGCFTMPWQIAAAALRPLGARNRQSPAPRFAWQSRWLFVGLASFDLAGRGLWASVVLLALAATATVTTPRWNGAWAAHLTRMAEDEAARYGFGRAGGDGRSSSRRPSPSMAVEDQIGRR